MNLFGVRVDAVSFDEAVARLVQAVEEQRQRPFFVATPNPEQIVEAQGNEAFRNALNAADLAIPDGYGVVMASRLLGGDIRERVSGIELFEELVKRAVENNWRVMLGGGKGRTAERAAQKLQTALARPGLVVQDPVLLLKGIEGLSDAKSPDKEQEKHLIDQIKEYKPELLFVGFGAPWQELFVARNLGKLNVRVVMAVGGAFDQIAHPSLRPPQVIDRMGLGWLYRLVRQPWRLRRQLRLLRFARMVFRAWVGGSQVSVDT